MLAVLAVASALAASIDVNQADADTLAALPGIGPEKAHAIVAYRDQHGFFASVDDLDAVPGVGAPTIAATRRWLMVRRAPAEAVPLAAPLPAATTVGTLDPNTATEDQLADLPGIGAIRAHAIIEDRDTRGLFESCDDLVRVDGVGPATVASIADRCLVTP